SRCCFSAGVAVSFEPGALMPCERVAEPRLRVAVPGLSVPRFEMIFPGGPFIARDDERAGCGVGPASLDGDGPLLRVLPEWMIALLEAIGPRFDRLAPRSASSASSAGSHP